MASNNGDMDTTLAHGLQPWFFTSQTMAANSSNSPWNLLSVPSGGNAFSFMINEPQARNEAAAYNSLLNHDREESSQQSRESVEQDKDSRQRHGLASDGSGEEDEQRPGKRHQAKNLVAERKRREKIRDGLHALRAIVPKITKMDKASILGDAIEYVKELQQQVKDLQDQLEEDNGKSQPEFTPSEPMNQGMDSCDPLVRDEEEKQQMEPQVEVKQLVANELFLMVLCEHKRGGFARLMEAMNEIGLEVNNASVTTFRSLVLHVFRGQVHGRNNIMVQAEEVRNSLLEMTRSCNKALLTTDAKDIEDNSVREYDHYHHHHQEQHHHHHHGGDRRRCHNPAPSPPTWP